MKAVVLQGYRIRKKYLILGLHLAILGVFFFIYLANVKYTTTVAMNPYTGKDDTFDAFYLIVELEEGDLIKFKISVENGYIGVLMIWHSEDFREKIGYPLTPPVFSANSATWGQELIAEWQVPSFGSYDIFIYQEGLVNEIGNVGITIIFPTWLNWVTGMPTILIGLLFVFLGIRSEKKDIVQATEKTLESNQCKKCGAVLPFDSISCLECGARVVSIDKDSIIEGISQTEGYKDEKVKKYQTMIEQIQPTIPYCSNHPNITAVVICPRCSKPFCEKCVVSIYGQNYLCHLCTALVYQEIYQK